MDYSSWIDTSLNLNLNPLRISNEAPMLQNKEVQINFMGVETNASEKDETSSLVEELNRVSAENKKLTEMLTVVCQNYNALRSQLEDFTSRNPEKESSPSKKRKSEGNDGISDSSSSDEESCKKTKEDAVKTKISRVHVPVDASDKSLVVRDGYQWRKYGQKVTRDNPCPRAYFRCSFAPSCPVKKKVQKSVEDQSVLVATYEGEHNHPPPLQTEMSSVPSRAVASGSPTNSASPGSSGRSLAVNQTKAKSSHNASSSTPQIDSLEFQKFLAEQMASSLTKDPNFTAALAAAISGRIHNQNSSEN